MLILLVAQNSQNREKSAEITKIQTAAESEAKWSKSAEKSLNLENPAQQSSCSCASCAKSQTPLVTLETYELNGVLPELVALQSGDDFELPVSSSLSLKGKIDQRFETDQRTVVQGPVSYPQAGFFYLEQTVAGEHWQGAVYFDQGEFAYQIEENQVRRVSVESVICGRLAVAEESLWQDQPTDFVPESQAGIVALNSLPGAEAVIWLDFGGKKAPHLGWPSYDAEPWPIDNDKIRETWETVAEHFAPFTINVTTERSVFEATPADQRMRCVFTKTGEIRPGSGGVAYLNSWGGDKVCWVFIRLGRAAGMAASHEVGHTLGLSHDGEAEHDGAEYKEYYPGHGMNTNWLTSWGPIMGAPYGANVAQWNNGDYAHSTNSENDLQMIVRKNAYSPAYSNEGVYFRTDDHGNTQHTASELWVKGDGAVEAKGVIETTGDVDLFAFEMEASGSLTVAADPAVRFASLNLAVAVLNEQGTVISTSAPEDRLDADLTVNLDAGRFYVRVEGVGRAETGDDPGFSDYGSLGIYTLSGSVTGAQASNRFEVTENSAEGTVVGQISPRQLSGNGLIYSLTASDPTGLFTVTGSGEVQVASGAVLNYEDLATNYQDEAKVTLTVKVETADRQSSETLAVEVLIKDVNEAPTFGQNPNTLDLIAGTSVSDAQILRIEAIDPDRYDLPVFSVTGTDAGFFTINAVGELSVGQTLPTDRATLNFNVVITDLRDTGMSEALAVTVNLVARSAEAEAFEPGGVSVAYYDGLIGGGVEDFSASRAADQSRVISKMSVADHGDHYGLLMQGLLLPPVTGNYRFYLAGDERAELLLSANEDRANLATVAILDSASGKEQFSETGESVSQWVTLEAGKAYFIEARLKEAEGADHLAVAWEGPTLDLQIISGVYVAPVPKPASSFLQAHWPMDQLVNGQLPSIVGDNLEASITSGTANFSAGILGDALDFGATTRVTLPAAAFAEVEDELTLSFRAYNPYRDESQILLKAKDRSGVEQMYIFLPSNAYNNPQVSFQCGSNPAEGNYTNLFKSVTYADYQDQWQHWTFVKSGKGDYTAIYCDGQLLHRVDGNDAALTNLDLIELGTKSFDYGGDFVGKLDDFRVYNKALSAVEIQNIYDEGQTVTASARLTVGTGLIGETSVPVAQVILSNPVGGNPTLTAIEANVLAGWEQLDALRIMASASPGGAGAVQIGTMTDAGTVNLNSNIQVPDGLLYLTFEADIKAEATYQALIDVAVNQLSVGGTVIIPTSANPDGGVIIEAPDRSYALQFDGSNDYLAMGNLQYSLGFNFADQDFGGTIYGAGNQCLAVAAWVKTGTSGTIFDWSTGSGYRQRLKAEISEVGYVIGYVNGQSNAPSVTAAFNVMDEQWHHVAMVLNENTLSLYVDGWKRGEVTNSGFNIGVQHNRNFHIGADRDGGAKFSGLMKDFRIYKIQSIGLQKTLSEAEIRSIMLDLDDNLSITDMDEMTRLAFERNLTNTAVTQFGQLDDPWMAGGGLTKYVGDVFYPAQAMPPADLAASQIAETTAQLNWTAPPNEGLGDGFELDFAYDYSFTAPVDGFPKTVSGNAHSLTDLTPGTAYYARMRTVKAGSTTAWTPITLFQTPGEVALPVVSFQSESTQAAQESGAYTITVTLDKTSAVDVTVPFSISGTATENEDFTVSSSPLIITAGETSAAVTVTVVADMTYELAETVILTLGTPTHATLGTTMTHTLTIENDDPVPFTVDVSLEADRLSWQVLDESWVSTYELLYLDKGRWVREASWQSGAGAYEWLLQDPDRVYQLAVTDRLGVVHFYTPTLVTEVAIEIGVGAGWNLAAVPLKLVNYGVMGELGLSQPLVWDNSLGLFWKSQAPNKNQGFWFFCSSQQVPTEPLVLTGYPLTTSEKVVELEPGWNLLGFAEKQTFNAERREVVYRWQNGQYEAVEVGDELVPGEGYWIYSFEDEKMRW